MGVTLQTYRHRIGTFQQGFSRGIPRLNNSEDFKVDLKAHLKVILSLNTLLIITALLNQCNSKPFLSPYSQHSYQLASKEASLLSCRSCSPTPMSSTWSEPSPHQAQCVSGVQIVQLNHTFKKSTETF